METEAGLPALGMVMIIALLQMAGRSALETEMLRSVVRYAMPVGPRWRR